MQLKKSGVSVYVPEIFHGAAFLFYFRDYDYLRTFYY